MTEVKYTFTSPVRNALVITPTIGKETLATATQFVNNQSTNHEVSHLMVVDGVGYHGEVLRHRTNMEDVNKQKYLVLPWNVGKDGGSWYGHRAYAAVAHLIPQKFDYVFLLDEDNWFRDDHIESCIELMEANPDLHFCHSLRTVYNTLTHGPCHGSTVKVRDDCESLGKWTIYLDSNAHLVDTSSYCFRRDFFRQVGHIWDFGWGGDRRFFNAMMKAGARYDCTGKYSLCYRTDGNNGSVTMDFFKEGNRIMKEKYPNGYPWSKE